MVREIRVGNLVAVDVVCHFCGAEHSVLCLTRQYDEWKQGKCIQDAMPDLSPGQRELLISGVCETCFDETFDEE